MANLGNQNSDAAGATIRLPTRRHILTALAAVSALPFVGCAKKQPRIHGPFTLGFDSAEVAAIALAYANATGDGVGPTVRDRLLRRGRPDPAAIQRTVSSDFAEGRIFVHRGWRLSHTEGRLFTLLARDLRPADQSPPKEAP